MYIYIHIYVLYGLLLIPLYAEMTVQGEVIAHYVLSGRPVERLGPELSKYSVRSTYIGGILVG